MASSCENKSTLLISKTKVNCFFCGVINCGKGNRSVSAFLVPKEKFQNWQQTFPRLKIGNKICDIHFDAEDIIKGVTIGNQFYPYKCKKLGVNAIPKHFISCKNTKEEKRKPLALKESNSIVISKPVGKTSHCGPRQEHCIAPKTKTTRKETIQPDVVVEKHISPQHGENTHAHYMPQVRDTPFHSTGQLHCEEELNVTMSDVLLYPDFRDCGKEFAHSPPTQIEIVHPSAEEQSLSLTFYDIENAVMGTTNSQNLQSVCDPGIQMDNSRSGPRNPDTPLSLQVVNTTHDCITLSWRQGFNGGLSQKYRIRYSQLGAEFIWYTDVFPTNETTFKVDRLKIGTEYQFSIMSFNDFGESDYSENIKAITNYSRERKTLHYKKSNNLRAARNSCHICNKYVSFTRKNSRTTKKIVCASCLPKLTTLERRLGTIQQKLRKTRQHLTRTKRELYRSSKAVKDANLNINALEKEVKNLKKQTLESIISVLPPKQQTIIKTFVLKHKVEMKSKTNRAHGMKYDSNFLMQALLIKMKSSKDYRHIREEGLLPLPSPNTLRRLISSSDCKFGFNELALQNIKSAMEGKKDSDRWGCLMFDEMSITGDLTFDPKLLEWHGIVDYGDGQEPKEKGIADHALVFIFRPYKGDWIQPFACFATKGAAKGDTLHELITKALCLLFNHLAIVKNCTSDGHQTNKKVGTLFGIRTINSCKQFFLHPLDSTIKVYWFVDVPHVLKCVRNHIFNHKIVQYAGKVVKFEYYSKLYELEKHLPLKRAHRLTFATIYPNNFQRMNVRRAAQILSRTVAMAIRHYREKESTAALFQGSEWTEKLTMLVNQVFDILNGRCDFQGINEENWNSNKKMLETMLQVLNQTEDLYGTEGLPKEMFCSVTTLRAFRIDILSTLALVEEMFASGYKLVLTGKLNQDPVERFFGIIRSINDTPTAHSWLHLFRILSLYYPTKRLIKNGNVSEAPGQEGNITVLVKYRECLVSRFKENEKDAEQVRSSLQDKLKSELFVRYVNKLDSDGQSDSTENEIIYDLCGYLLHTRKWALECFQCKKLLLTSTETDLPTDFKAADYTLSRSHGGLQLATPEMFNTFREVEVVIKKHFQDGRHIYLRDSYEKVIEKIGEKNLMNVCCENHPNTLPNLIMDYVVIRFHFESKRYRSNILYNVQASVHKNKKLSKCVNTINKK